MPSTVGSPVARVADIFSLALAFREKAHRSTIIPPSPVARLRNGCTVSVLLNTKTSTSGAPITTAQKSRSSDEGRSLQTLSQCLDEPRLSDDSSLVLILDEFEHVPPSLNSRATRKRIKNSTLSMVRNERVAKTQMARGFWRRR